MSSSFSTFNTMTEVPLSKAPNPQLFPGRRSINGYPLLRVCVTVCVFTADRLNAEHKFRVWVTILGCMSRHFTSLMSFTKVSQMRQFLTSISLLEFKSHKDDFITLIQIYHIYNHTLRQQKVLYMVLPNVIWT